MPDLLIVIPTYNEIANLPRLVESLFERVPDAQILIIDDDSPDGTGRWCDEAALIWPQLRVLHRPNRSGLGSATLSGFRAALEEGFQRVATMDADFSHDPEQLNDLQRAMEQAGESTGVVIGSRYIDGGKIVGWPWHRRIASRLVNRYAKVLLRLPVRDATGAFRVYRTSALRKIDLSEIRSLGYGYLEEILWRLTRASVQMIEVPITFKDRQRGNSKASLKEGLKVLLGMTRLRMRS